jgi:hypothetical protein
VTIWLPRKKRLLLAVLVAASLAIVITMLLSLAYVQSQSLKWGHCIGNLKQISLALRDYSQGYGSLPPPYIVDKAGRPTVSWRVLILPYLLRDDLYCQVRLDEPWNSPHNLRLAASMPDCFRCPADKHARDGETNYVAVVSSGTHWAGARSGKFPTPSRTILVAEMAQSGISWMEPRDLPVAVAAKGVAKAGGSGMVCCHACGGGDEPIKGVYDGYMPWKVGYRLFGANCLFADGQVLTVSDSVPHDVLAKLLVLYPAA